MATQGKLVVSEPFSRLTKSVDMQTYAGDKLDVELHTHTQTQYAQAKFRKSKQDWWIVSNVSILIVILYYNIGPNCYILQIYPGVKIT